MTIAAGFVYRDGILLCADTELTGWITLHEAKISQFSCSAGNVGIAYSGNSGFAASTIQKCKRKLGAVAAVDFIGELETIIDKEYRRTVLSHPSQATDTSLPYKLLIAVTSNSGDAALYVTDQTAMHQISTYECIGVGEVLAHYLVRPTFSPDIGERQMLSLATFMLACVKGYVSGCGGMSQFLGLRKDGTVGHFFAGAGPGVDLRTNTDWLERHSKGFDPFARRILFDIPNPDINDADFDGNLEIFCNEMRRQRKDWREKSYVHESFADLLAGKPKTVNLEDRIALLQTEASLKSPPPSTEPPVEA
jgi:hypothetical protein